MKVAVDADRCSGHARCWAACPEVFDVDEVTGLAIVLLHDVPAELQDRVLEAERDCPEMAVSISH